MIRIAVIVLGMLLSFAANAQTVSVGRYLHPKDQMDHNFHRLYLAGVKDGLLVYGVASTEKLYCQPGQLALTNEQANDIVQRWVKKQTMNMEDFPVALALLYGLQETFPCPK